MPVENGPHVDARRLNETTLHYPVQLATTGPMTTHTHAQRKRRMNEVRAVKTSSATSPGPLPLGFIAAAVYSVHPGPSSSARRHIRSHLLCAAEPPHA